MAEFYHDGQGKYSVVGRFLTEAADDWISKGNQKLYLRASCITRGLVVVPVICPKVFP